MTLSVFSGACGPFVDLWRNVCWRPLPNFHLGCLLFCCWACRSSLHILATKPLSGIWFANIFLHSAGSVFTCLVKLIHFDMHVHICLFLCLSVSISVSLSLICLSSWNPHCTQDTEHVQHPGKFIVCSIFFLYILRWKFIHDITCIKASFLLLPSSVPWEQYTRVCVPFNH